VAASKGKPDRWSRREFIWVDSFEIEYVGFEPVEQDNDGIVGDVQLILPEYNGTVRYRFRWVTKVK
jgi:hypothetical protein